MLLKIVCVRSSMFVSLEYPDNASGTVRVLQRSPASYDRQAG